MREGMALLDHIGANMDRPYLLALLSEIAAANGQPSEALAQVTEALGLLRESRTYFYEAELYRLRGVLILQTGGRAAEDEAEANFRQALEIAKKQKARALELRSAVSLCRLLQARGMPRDGLRFLAPAYELVQGGRRNRRPDRSEGTHRRFGAHIPIRQVSGQPRHVERRLTRCCQFASQVAGAFCR